jgi:TonB family protein
MKSLLICLSVIVLTLIGCATSSQTPSPSEQPEIVNMTSLPPVAPNFPTNGLKLNILFHVKGDGSVTEAKMLGSSGDPAWDRAAVDSMKLWRFTPKPLDGSSTGQWIRNTIILQLQELTVLTLGELAVGNQQGADSLYSLLQNGSDFDALMKQIGQGSSASFGRYIGAVDIARYPKHVRDALRKLGVNDFTRPIRIGSKYTIYKRYQSDGPIDLPQ